MKRWDRFGAYPASGAVFALFGGNALTAGTLNARPAIAAAIQLILLGVFIAYCFARSHGGALLAATVVGSGFLIGVLSVIATLLAVAAALVALAASVIVASRLDQRDDEIAPGKPPTGVRGTA